MTPQHTLVLVRGRRSAIAWGLVCAVNVALCMIVIGALQIIEDRDCRDCGVHNKDGADIVSKGRDRILGTADDILSWER